jgi:hypothetical protein
MFELGSNSNNPSDVTLHHFCADFRARRRRLSKLHFPASCTAPGCTASGPLTPGWNVTCPVAANLTCTFVLQANVAFSSTSGDSPFVTCKVDGKVPCQYFTIPTPDASGTLVNPGNMTFVVSVKNTSASQVHPVEVDYGCTDNTGDGCQVTAINGQNFRASYLGVLRIDVYTP